MTDNMEQWLLWAQVLFYVCSGIVLILVVLSFVAYHRITHGQRMRELLGILAVAAGGSVIGSILVGILGYYLALVNYPNTDEYGAALVGAAFGMIFSIPIGVIGGSSAGAMIAALLWYLNFRRSALVASAGSFVIGALSSGVALVPIGFIFFALGHI